MISTGVDLDNLVDGSLPSVSPYRVGAEEWKWWIESEEKRLMELGVIERVEEEEGLNPTASGFMVPKRSAFRLVLDLRPLNKITPKEELTPPLPRVEDLLPHLVQGSHLTVYDLRDAFYSVSYADTRRDLRCFGMRGPSGEPRIYLLRCLAMGWCNSPARLVSLTVAFMQRIRSWECCHVAAIYIDDILLVGRTLEETEELHKRTKNLLTQLGFKLKDPHPPIVQAGTYLGLQIDLQAKELRLPRKKVNDLKLQARSLIIQSKAAQRWVRLDSLRSFVGKAQAATVVIGIGRAYLRSLYDAIHSTPSYRHRWLGVKLSRQQERDLRWWEEIPLSSVVHFVRPFQPRRAKIRVWYDASTTGFGTVIEVFDREPLTLAGQWTSTQRSEHITSLEGRAAFLATEAYVNWWLLQEDVGDEPLELIGDSFAVVTALTKSTSPSSDVMRSIRKISKLQLMHGLRVTHRWVPTSVNQADWPSRLRLTESYKFRFARQLSQRWKVPLTVDRFASYYNKQTKLYNSVLRSPGSLGSAWDCKWTGDGNFWNPPFSLLSRVLHKIIVEKPGNILIVPRWPTKPWFGLLEHLRQGPRLMYCNLELYENESGELLPSPPWATLAIRILPS